MASKDNKMLQEKNIDTVSNALSLDMRKLIEDTRLSIAVAVNTELTLLYWIEILQAGAKEYLFLNQGKFMRLTIGVTNQEKVALSSKAATVDLSLPQF
ncbi:MAG: hypothetical protein WC340_09300 [Kiritimatiellia bacterium]